MKIKILIVDNNIKLCTVLKEFFDSQEDMEVVGEAYDGEQALEKIDALSPDVIILDITMPHLDGLGVLEKLKEKNMPYRPRIIVLSAFGKDDLISRVTMFGVDYFVLKPFNLKMLAERVRQFSKDDQTNEFVEEPTVSYQSSNENIKQRITKLLHHMGIPPHFKGFIYLRDAVSMCLIDGYVGGGLTKELYPALATKYNTTKGGVEAAIRNAVIAAWENGDTKFIAKLCGEHRGHKIPTNSLIIAKLAEEAKAS